MHTANTTDAWFMGGVGGPVKRRARGLRGRAAAGMAAFEVIFAAR